MRSACPACDAPAGGNICEDCGEPNVCADLVEPASGRSDAPPVTGTATRYSLPLHEFRDDIAAHYDIGHEFFAMFLDETLTYSSAVFPEAGVDLADASRNKYDLLLGKRRAEKLAVAAPAEPPSRIC